MKNITWRRCADSVILAPFTNVTTDLLTYLLALLQIKPATSAYLVRAGSKQQQVERDCGHHVYEEPTLEVMDGDLGRMTDHLIFLVHVRRPEVDKDVDDEHDVDNQVDYCDRVVIPTERRIT